MRDMAHIIDQVIPHFYSNLSARLQFDPQFDCSSPAVVSPAGYPTLEDPFWLCRSIYQELFCLPKGRKSHSLPFRKAYERRLLESEARDWLTVWRGYKWYSELVQFSNLTSGFSHYPTL